MILPPCRNRCWTSRRCFRRHGLADCEIGALDRDAFYDRAQRAFALVRTGELRPYGNILLVKGVVNRYEPIRRTDSRPGPR